MNESINIKTDSFILAKCYDHAGNVAITNPVYIRNNPFTNQGYLSNVTIIVTGMEQETKAEYWLDDNTDRISFRGTAKLKMNPASKLYVVSNGITRTILLFQLEELQSIFKELYFGRFNSDGKYNPGEVPAEYFKLHEIKKILDDVTIHIDL